MKRSKNLPAGSAKVTLDAMVSASSPLPACPSYVVLRDQDRPFWLAILCARARDEWNESDLVVGAQLARCRADIERESTLLDSESTVILNHRQTQVANPRVSVLEQLARRQIMLMRALRMGGSIPIRNLNERRGVELAAKRAHDEVADEDQLESLLG